MASTSPPPKQPPSSWAKLFSQTAAPAVARDSSSGVNGTGSADANDPSLFPKANTGSLAEAVRAYSVGRAEKVSFIEPRGLINTGNMCYMNSVSFQLITAAKRQVLTR